MTKTDAPFSLITGASLGIGKAIAIECASRGMNLVLVALPGENLPEIANAIADKYKVRVLTIEIDLSLHEAPEKIFVWVRDQGIQLNMLVNNAGFGMHGPFTESKHELNLTMLRLHVLSTYSMVSFFLPLLLEQPKSYILNVGSIAGVTPTPFKTLYAATKSFVFSFTRALERELKNSTVRVSCLVPGGVVTNEKVKARIHSAGWLSRRAAIYPEFAAKRAIHRLLKGKPVTVPGWGGKIGYMLARYLPLSIGLRILEGPMRKKSE